MDKKSIVLLLVASSIATSTFAVSMVDKFKPGSQAPTVKAHKATKRSDQQQSYTDFSGTWVANCGNGSENWTTVIENDANYISLDGNEFKIGQGLVGEFRANNDEVGYEHSSFEWNADGSALIMKGVDISKASEDKSAIETGLRKFTLTKKNDQLSMDGTFMAFNDVTVAMKPITVHCTFVKQDQQQQQ